MEITGRAKQFDLSASARRVLAFHNLFFSPPIVVLRVPERQKNEAYASTPSAVRSLADDYGLKVIVDGSPNSLPEELLRTLREEILNIEPMKRELLESIFEFECLIKFLYDHQLADGVWAVLGGSPAEYVKLRNVYRRNIKFEANVIVEAIKDHITSVLITADDTLTDSSSNTKKIIRFFRLNGVLRILKNSLESKKLIFDSPNQVLEDVHFGGVLFLVPATPAIGLMINADQSAAVVTEILFAKKSENMAHGEVFVA